MLTNQFNLTYPGLISHNLYYDCMQFITITTNNFNKTRQPNVKGNNLVTDLSRTFSYLLLYYLLYTANSAKAFIAVTYCSPLII